MSSARFPRRQTRHAALLTVASAALLTTAACAGTTAEIAPSHLGAAPSVSASASASATGASPTSAAPVVTHSTQSAGTAPSTSTKSTAKSTTSAIPACGNDDLAMGLGYGTQSYPVQDASIVFTNVGTHTCTLRGYPGAAIVVDGKTVNATRVLNVHRGDLPALTSPPLVTLAPDASGYAVFQWVIGKGPDCYPTGAGRIEATAPNTTRTEVLSTAAIIGQSAVCSGFEISPVVLGYFGVPVGVPARN